MRLDIAEVGLILEFSEIPMALRARRRYAGFLRASEAHAGDAFTLQIAVRHETSIPGLHPEFVDNPPARAEGDLEHVHLAGADFEAELDFARGRGRAAIPDSLAHADLVVRTALGLALLRRGGTLLHAAAVLRDGFAIAFAGPSGAGKSTVATVCREIGLPVLADEMVAFRRIGAGARFFGTPYWRGAPDSGPAGALLFLQQALRRRATHVPPSEAVPLLLAAGGAPIDLPAVHEAFFAAAGEVLRRTPAYRLEFTPDPGFWDVLDQRDEFSFFRPTPRTTRLARLPVAPGACTGCGA